MSEYSKTSSQASSSGELSKCSKRGMQKGNFCQDNKKFACKSDLKKTVNCTDSVNLHLELFGQHQSFFEIGNF